MLCCLCDFCQFQMTNERTNSSGSDWLLLNVGQHNILYTKHSLKSSRASIRFPFSLFSLFLLVAFASLDQRTQQTIDWSEQNYHVNSIWRANWLLLLQLALYFHLNSTKPVAAFFARASRLLLHCSLGAFSIGLLRHRRRRRATTTLRATADLLSKQQLSKACAALCAHLHNQTHTHSAPSSSNFRFRWREQTWNGLNQSKYANTSLSLSISSSSKIISA